MNRKNNLQRNKKNYTKENQKNNEHKLHYQVYLQEDRPNQPKEEDEIDY
ncbi:hypothetical protein QA612_08425 [Evansella sp. AB-P1]|nr:hypothetical protein [Evansella sp. AB-P1]MDG5787519.1 hypothetical protein [Evansella sp. AB-P1]